MSSIRRSVVSRSVALALVVALACGTSFLVAAPVGAQGDRSTTSVIGSGEAVDDDFIVDYLTPAGPVDPASAMAVPQSMTPSADVAVAGGYKAYPFSSGMPVGLGAGYTVHVVTDHAQYAQLSAPAAAAAIQLTAATGIPFTMGGPVSQHSGNQALDHRITISLTSGEKCGTAGCTRFRAYNCCGSYWELMGGAVWVNPLLLSYPDMLKETILHEFGHAAGLDHFDSDFEGHHQVMRSYVDTDSYGSYQTGDQNGLAQTAAYGVSQGYLIPRACLITITDVRITDQFCSDIRWLVESGISTGFTDGSFRPTWTLTRQAAAAYLYALAGEPPVPGNAPTFPDVPVGNPFRNAIRWMAAEHITSGYVDGTFRPTESLTRQTMAAYLYAYAGSPGVPGDAPTFTDVPEGNLFRDAIRWMAAEHIASGYVDGTFRPTATLTRQVVAAFLHDYET